MPVAAVRPTVLVLVAGLFGTLAVAASFLAPRATGPWPQVVAVLLVAVGMLLAQSLSAPRLLRLTAPVLGVVGGAVATGAMAEGPVVALVGACAGAALVALTGRSAADADRYVPRVWLSFAGGLGVLALLVLVMGLSLTAVAAIALAVVTLLARVVPDLVIDVDDDVLLDISRLSVTSWSPREARRPRRRGWRIDDRAVESVVRAASVEQLATLVGLAVVSAGSSAVLLGVLATGSASSPLSVELLLLAAATALTLTARAYRRRRDRTLLRLAALAPTLAVGIPAVAALGSTWGVVAPAPPWSWRSRWWGSPLPWAGGSGRCGRAGSPISWSCSGCCRSSRWPSGRPASSSARWPSSPEPAVAWPRFRVPGEPVPVEYPVGSPRRS